MFDTTVAIVARNAEATIERAVRSARAQEGCALLLVDDGSEDRTIEKAVGAAGGSLRVRNVDQHRTLGHARQIALEAVDTEFAVWLDADDECLPGRADQLVGAMRAEGTDLAVDGAEVRDGATGAFVRAAPVPPFMMGRRVAARLFERNYLPIVGPVAFRTAWARSIGYDVAMHGGEDFDLLLRGIAAGGEYSLAPDIGYRLYTYPHSLSRWLDNQRRMLRYSLAKHDAGVIDRLYARAGYDRRTTIWGHLSISLFRDEFAAATDWLRELDAGAVPADAVVEPEGPYPFPEGWRLDFHAGTVALLRGDLAEAADRLAAAERRRPTAEGANNLGVARFRQGQPDRARQLFARALELRPDYLDPALNAQAERPERVTTHPFRVSPSREDYPRD
ncbi:MAG TPA: glycosyltransferase [Vicinamibacterales bacterium]|jgi:glycosyltransferase involved in cell wall biosynthesis